MIVSDSADNMIFQRPSHIVFESVSHHSALLFLDCLLSTWVWDLEVVRSTCNWNRSGGSHLHLLIVHRFCCVEVDWY